jgi:hypothetical protein
MEKMVIDSNSIYPPPGMEDIKLGEYACCSKSYTSTGPSTFIGAKMGKIKDNKVGDAIASLRDSILKSQNPVKHCNQIFADNASYSFEDMC